MDLLEAIEQAQKQPAAYVLLGCDQNYLYKGACRNLHDRLRDHHAGRCSRTKNRRPLTLFYHEYCNSYAEALLREKYFKSRYGRVWLKRLMKAKHS